MTCIYFTPYRTYLLSSTTRCGHKIPPNFIYMNLRRLTTDGLCTIYLFSLAEEPDGLCTFVR